MTVEEFIEKLRTDRTLQEEIGDCMTDAEICEIAARFGVPRERMIAFMKTLPE